MGTLCPGEGHLAETPSKRKDTVLLVPRLAFLIQDILFQRALFLLKQIINLRGRKGHLLRSLKNLGVCFYIHFFSLLNFPCAHVRKKNGATTLHTVSHSIGCSETLNLLEHLTWGQAIFIFFPGFLMERLDRDLLAGLVKMPVGVVQNDE